MRGGGVTEEKKKKGGKIISHIYGAGGGRCGCREREQLQFPHDKKQLHSFPDVVLSGRKDSFTFTQPKSSQGGSGGSPRLGGGGICPSCFAAKLFSSLAVGRVREMLQTSPASQGAFLPLQGQYFG